MNIKPFKEVISGPLCTCLKRDVLLIGPSSYTIFKVCKAYADCALLSYDICRQVCDNIRT